ncbi:MAG: hypothetical protein J6I79_08675 [Paludibacteraceae bacterium]|nr:hypothetical protein [Paludibacteraceae bacterium]MBP3717552.1 hypothetical protein [Paludibacteraceae bacterium]
MRKLFFLALAVTPLLSIAADKGYVYSLPLKFYLTYADGGKHVYKTWWTNQKKVVTTDLEDAEWIKGRIEETRGSIYQLAPSTTKIDSVEYNFNCIELVYDMSGVFDANSVARGSGIYLLNEKGEFVHK